MDQKINKILNSIVFDEEYIPGAIESLDRYKISNKSLGVSSYGPTKEKALKTAKLQLKLILLDKKYLIEEILKNLKK